MLRGGGDIVENEDKPEYTNCLSPSCSEKLFRLVAIKDAHKSSLESAVVWAGSALSLLSYFSVFLRAFQKISCVYRQLQDKF